MASVPGWVAFFDPNYASMEKGVLNRVNKDDWWLSSIGKITIGTFSNSEKCFAPTRNELIQLRPKVNFPENE